VLLARECVQKQRLTQYINGDDISTSSKSRDDESFSILQNDSFFVWFGQEDLTDPSDDDNAGMCLENRLDVLFCGLF